MTLMDKVRGWSEEEWVGSNLAACMLIYTKAVFTKGRGCEPPLELDFIQGFIVESLALNYEIDVPCPLQ